jgi:excisionase family DNA binding protein
MSRTKSLFTKNLYINHHLIYGLSSEVRIMASDTLLCSIPEALERVSVGRSFLYERLADGSIRSVKAGKRRLVDVRSLTSWAASLPESQLKQVSKR